MMGIDGQLERGQVVVGWVVQPIPGREEAQFGQLAKQAAEAFGAQLSRQFPHFRWVMDVTERAPCQAEQSRLDPLQLLGIGCNEKLVRRWDFALVVTQADLVARTRPFTLGTPSSALETAVLSTNRYPADEDEPWLRMAAVAQYLLGHMLGLSPSEPGAMRRPLDSGQSELGDFSEEDRETVEARLEEVADLRLEEAGEKPGLGFWLRTLIADPKGILVDVLGYEPWKQPFRLGRLTAAAFVSMLLLFLGAESWELGMATRDRVLGAGAFLSILAGTVVLYHGQNLHELTRQRRLSEQLVRSRVVLKLTLLSGMASLWLMLLVLSFLIALSFPREVIAGWVGHAISLPDLLRFSFFTSTLGTLAGALGGNLEDEGSFKSKLLIDEES
ncbi:MAG: hypothetical protein Q7Q71_09995 [Verrucomicrobiota bacterium JB023]|nr:hypothetical protein [Verrucomicrobiota bacterium JB023]